MKANIQSSRLKGTLKAPASKSSMQRALAAALIKHGITNIQNPGFSEDDRAAIGIIKALGTRIEMVNDELTVDSRSNFRETRHFPNAIGAPLTLDCGESGLAIRMFTPIAALSNQEIRITGSGSLARRPMDFFDDVLPKLGVRVQTNQGMLPMTIHGRLRPVDIEVDGSLSSQFLTGLIMAFSAAGAHNATIKVNNLKSKPYIDLTLDVLSKFGLPVPVNKNYSEFIFKQDSRIAELKIQETTHYTVEADWSNTSFLLVAGAIAGPLMITGLDLNSTQADRKIIDALLAANANISMEPKGIKMGTTEMNAFEFDATDCPDLFPPLVVLAAYCNGTSIIQGVSRLKHKESNRALSLQQEFGKMDIRIELDGDIMMIHGNKNIKGAKVHSHHDHRVAMACSVAALAATGTTIVAEAEAVNKSYPDFYDDLKKAGAAVSLDNKIKLHE